MKFTRLNPVTGEVASEAEAMQAADMAAVAEKAQQGFEAWSKVGPNARRAVLQTLYLTRTYRGRSHTL